MVGDNESVTLEIAADCSWAGELNRLAMADGITLVHLAERRSTLEEAFFEITRNCGKRFGNGDSPCGTGGPVAGCARAPEAGRP